MKILFVAPRFHTNQFLLIKTLLEKKHEITFHVAGIGPTEDHSLIVPVHYKQSKLSVFVEMIFGKGASTRKNYFPAPLTYWNVFRKLRPAMVVIRDPYKLFSLMVAFYALLTKARIVFYTQEDVSRPRTRKTLLKQKLTIRFFKAAWMTPIKNGQTPANNDGLKYMYYVPLPVTVKPDNNIYQEMSADGPRILMIGKYHQERKKHLLLLQALDKLKSRYRFKVTIAGECAKEEQRLKFEIISDTAKKLELAGMVELKKNVPYNKMAALYASHHIFVIPAINEPYAISVNEAMGYGLPVICTDTCGSKCNISNGENGFVIKSDNLDELTTSLEILISDYQKLKQMQERSLQYARENLSADVFYSRFAHLARERFSILMN